MIYVSLEGVVYYLSGKGGVSIYGGGVQYLWICDEESYQQNDSREKGESVINPGHRRESAVVYKWRNHSGETLKANFVNGKTAPEAYPTRIIGVAEATAVMEAAVFSSGGKKTTSAGPGTVTEEPEALNSRRKCRLKIFLHRGLPETLVRGRE